MNNAQLNLGSSLLQQVSVPLLMEALLTMPSLGSWLLKAAWARTPGFLCLTTATSPTSSLVFAHWLQDHLDQGFSTSEGGVSESSRGWLKQIAEAIPQFLIQQVCGRT